MFYLDDVVHFYKYYHIDRPIQGGFVRVLLKVHILYP